LLERVLAGVEKDAGAAALIWFELQLLAACGWAPRWEEAGGTARILRSLAGANWTAAQRVQLNAAQAQEAQEALGRFWLEQVGRRPRSASGTRGKNSY
jgi:hypothetical protein